MKSMHRTMLGTLLLVGASSCSSTGTEGSAPAEEPVSNTAAALTSPFLKPMVDKVGTFQNGNWYLDKDGDGVWESCSIDMCTTFGVPGDIAVVGDWIGDGFSRIGVYHPADSTWYLDNGNGVWNINEDFKFTWNPLGGTVKPVVYKGSPARVGVFRDGTWRIANTIPPASNGYESIVNFGMAGDLPFSLRFNPSVGSSTKIGVYRPSSGRFLIDKDGSRSWTTGDINWLLATSTDRPVVGNFTTPPLTVTSNTNDNVGFFRTNGTWFFDVDSNPGVNNGCTTDNCINSAFGTSVQQPVVGNWPDTEYVAKRCDDLFLNPRFCSIGEKCVSVLTYVGGQFKMVPTCLCASGFQANEELDVCVDINECATNPCGENTVCVNVAGTYRCDCDPSKPGYQDHGNVCCAPGIPADGLQCQCGAAEGQSCCGVLYTPGSTYDGCDYPLVCDAGTCRQCGDANKPCCSDYACNTAPGAPLECRDDTCTSCVSHLHVCSSSSQCCDGLLCIGSLCRGDSGDACTSGAQCASGNCHCGGCDRPALDLGESCFWNNAAGQAIADCQCGYNANAPLSTPRCSYDPGGTASPGGGSPLRCCVGLCNYCDDDVDCCGTAGPTRCMPVEPDSDVKRCCASKDHPCTIDQDCCTGYLCEDEVCMPASNQYDPPGEHAFCVTATQNCSLSGVACGEGKPSCCSELVCNDDGECDKVHSYTVMGFQPSNLAFQYKWDVPSIDKPVGLAAGGFIDMVNNSTFYAVNLTNLSSPIVAVQAALQNIPQPRTFDLVDEPGWGDGSAPMGNWAWVILGEEGQSSLYQIQAPGTILNKRTVHYKTANGTQLGGTTVAIGLYPTEAEGLAAIATTEPDRLLRVHFYGDTVLNHIPMDGLPPVGLVPFIEDLFVLSLDNVTKSASLGVYGSGLVQTSRVSLAGTPVAVDGMEREHKIVVALNANQSLAQSKLVVLSSETLAVTHEYAIDGEPVAFKLTERDGGYAWVAAKEPSKLYRFNLVSHTFEEFAVDMHGEPVDLALGEPGESPCSEDGCGSNTDMIHVLFKQ